jgi:hypothetical protein
MSLSRRLKHLLEADWPAEDRQLFEKAFAKGDIFDGNAGTGAHLSERTRRTMCFGWRRWLGFLATNYPEDLGLTAADRITPERVRSYIEHLPRRHERHLGRYDRYAAL